MAQLAINAREAHVKARARVDQAVADMESAEIVKQKLLKDLQELRGQQEKLQLEDAKVPAGGVVKWDANQHLGLAKLGSMLPE